MSNKKIIASKGVTFLDMLFLLFLFLKLAGYVTWSWWWVTSPLWMPIVIVLGILLIFFTVLGVAWIISKLFRGVKW